MDLYRQNEINANKYVVKCLRIMTLAAALLWLLNAVNIFIVDKSLMNIAMPAGMIFFVIPSFIQLRCRDKYLPCLKYLYLGFTVLGLTILSAMLTIHTVLLWIIPIQLSCHYYSGKLSACVLGVSIFFLIASYIFGLYYGVWDSNVMLLKHDDFLALGLSPAEYIQANGIIQRGMIFYVLPRTAILCGISPICFTLSKRTRNLLSEQAKLNEEKNRINTELNVATNIQADLLPRIFPAFPERHEFDIFASMTPAKEVGGDFYDFFLIDSDHLAIVMADVSGKGIPAALFMVITKTLLKNSAQTGLSPKAILETVNTQLCENNQAEMFVTVWLGVYEISTGSLTCANAGHEYPVLCRSGGKYEFYKDKHGFVLAGMENSRYREYTLTLSPGDKLFLYTDGVTEATDSENALFGDARLLTALNTANAASSEEMLSTVRRSIDRFVGSAPQFDDITMLQFTVRSLG